MHIRRANEDDVDRIALVLQISFAEFRPLYTPAAYAATTLDRDQIFKRMHEGPIWIASEDTDIVGTLSAIPKDSAALYLRSMAIVPTARGTGIGRLLLNEAERFAVQNGFNTLTLNTTPFLTRAIHVYKRFGFCFQNESPQDLFGTPIITMVKALEIGEKKV